MQNLDFKTPEGRKNKPFENLLRKIRSEVENLLEGLTKLPQTDPERRELLKKLGAALFVVLGVGYIVKRFSEGGEMESKIKTLIKKFFGKIIPHESRIILTPPIPTQIPTPSIVKIETPTPSEITPTPKPSPTPEVIDAIKQMLERVEKIIKEEYGAYLIEDNTGVERLEKEIEDFFKRNRELFEVFERITSGRYTEEVERFLEGIKDSIKPLFPNFDDFTLVGTLIWVRNDLFKSYPLSNIGADSPIFVVGFGLGPIEPGNNRVYFPFLHIDLSKQASLSSGEVAQLVLKTTEPKGNLNNGFLIGFTYPAPRMESGPTTGFTIIPTLPFILGLTTSGKNKILDFDYFGNPKNKILVLAENVRICLFPPLEKQGESFGIIRNPWIIIFYNFFGVRLFLSQVFQKIIDGAKISLESPETNLKELKTDLENVLELVNQFEDIIKKSLDKLFSSNVKDRDEINLILSLGSEVDENKKVEALARRMALRVPDDNIREEVKKLIFNKFWGDIFNNFREEIRKIIETIPKTSFQK